MPKWSPATWAILLTLILFALTVYLDNIAKQETIDSLNASLKLSEETILAKNEEIQKRVRDNTALLVQNNEKQEKIIFLTLENRMLLNKNYELTQTLLSVSQENDAILLKRVSEVLELVSGANASEDIWGLDKLVETNETIKVNVALSLAGTNPEVSLILLNNVSEENYKVKYFSLGQVYESSGDLEAAFECYLELFDRTFDISKGPPYDIDIMVFGSILCDFQWRYNYSTERVTVSDPDIEGWKVCEIRTTDYMVWAMRYKTG